MIRLWTLGCKALALALALTSPTLAQDSTPEADRGYLQALIEDNLSSEGTQVRIEGFVGSLASKSSFDRLTVADKDGIWLTLDGASLDWRRRALLSGKLDITELTVRRIVLDRLPTPTTATAEAEAAPFKLPDLPVEVNLEAINAASIVLGPSVLGVAAELSLAGSANLSGGDGRVDLALNRIDGPRGSASLSTSYSNTDEALALDLLSDEAAGGIAAQLLDIYQKPPVRLSIKGDGFLSDFKADINLSTSDTQALTGHVTLAAADDAAPDSKQFSARISGNIAPLLEPRFTPFLGAEVALDIAGQRHADSRIQLEQLRLQTAAFLIEGQLDLAANGMPEQFNLDAEIKPSASGNVVLPLSGPDTAVKSVTLTADYNAATGDVWELDAQVTGLVRDGLSIASAHLTGGGTIAPESPKGVTAKLRFDADGADHENVDFARALGPAFTANAAIDWQQDTPLKISALTFDGAGLSLTGDATVDGPETGFLVSGQTTLAIADLARFSGLIKRDIAGAADVALSGQTALHGGSFDIVMQAQTTDLKTGVDRLDPLLFGRGTVALAATRGADGLDLTKLDIETEHAKLSSHGKLTSDNGQMTFTSSLTNLAALDPTLAGPATAQGAVSWASGAPVVLDSLQATGAGITLRASGQVDIDDPDLPVAGEVRAGISDLSRLNGLTGLSLEGRVSATAEGSAKIRLGDFDVSLDATTQSLRTGIAEADRLLAGQGIVSAKLSRTDTVYTIEHLDLKTPAAQLNAKSDGANTPIQFKAALANIAMIAPDFSGPAKASGTALPDGDKWVISLDGSGPGGITADLRGTLANDFKTTDIAIAGTAPLGLINPFISPRSLRGRLTYDLRLNGAPKLENLSGRINTSDARMSAPTLHVVLTNIGADISLSGGTAQLALSGAVQGGGTVQVKGPLSLTAPFNAGLEATLTSVSISDPRLYTTRVDGGFTINGPLTAGGSLTGRLTLGETEIQVPNGQASGAGYIPDITHLGETSTSRTTRRRAGLLAVKSDGAKSGAALGLDLQILAPGRIFVRGRGLDAEFGGDLRLLGDTAAIAPQGQFDLIRGRLDILGKRFDLTQGLISIQGAFDPYISLIAETQNDAVTSRIIIEGPASDLDVRFASDPELPEDEVVAQLLFGRDLTSLSAFQLAQLASAVATLTGRGGEGVVAKLRSGIGLDDLDVSSNDAGETQVRAGKYLSENLYSDIAVDAGGKTEVNLNLDINSNLKLKGRVTSEGNTGVGIHYQRDY